MYREYTVSTGFKFLYGTIAAISGFAAIGMLIELFNDRPNPSLYFLTPVVIILTLIFLNNLFKKVVVKDDTIISGTIFTRRQLTFNQIKGFRMGDKLITVESVSSDHKSLNIRSAADYTGIEELRNLLREKFIDLNAADMRHEEDVLLQNKSLGATEAERQAALAKAKQYVITFNIAGAFSGIIGLFVTNSYAAACLMLLPPIIACVLMLASKGLIMLISNPKTSPYPSVILGVMLPVMFGAGVGFTRYHILQYNHFWLPFAVIGMFILLLMLLSGRNKSQTAPGGQLIFMLILSLAYGAGATVQLNGTLDNSYPVKFNTSVESKRITHSKGAHYHLTLAPWQRGQKSMEIDVSAAEYEQTAVDAPVGVHTKTGFFHIPWFYVDLGE